MEKKIKFTTMLPGELIKELKIRAIEEHTTCNAIITVLIKKYLECKEVE